MAVERGTPTDLSEEVEHVSVDDDRWQHVEQDQMESVILVDCHCKLGDVKVDTRRNSSVRRGDHQVLCSVGHFHRQFCNDKGVRVCGD
jgi:hypothetical protein